MFSGSIHREPNFLTYANLERILRSLLKEGVPIRDLATILETAVDSLATTKDLDMVAEHIDAGVELGQHPAQVNADDLAGEDDGGLGQVVEFFQVVGQLGDDVLHQVGAHGQVEALSRTITRRFCEHGQLRVVTLDAEVEKRVIWPG